MVYTYYEIGRMIVEDEQQRKERAEYGKSVLKELSVKLLRNLARDFPKEIWSKCGNFTLHMQLRRNRLRNSE
jgi:hypothetical protein